jgi:hypothetical protein
LMTVMTKATFLLVLQVKKDSHSESKCKCSKT